MKNIVIVTGGSSGLGKELAKETVKRGDTVCIIARNQQKLDETVGELGKDSFGFCGDLCDEEFVKETINKISRNFKVKILYNCAGIGIFGAPKDMNLQKIEKVMNSNVIGLMNITYEFCKYFTENATIVNIMSTAGLKGNANESLYCASKWAVRGFTEALKAYYKNTLVNVIGVYPGGMKTAFWKDDCGISPDVSKFMDPKEVAELIVSSVSERKTLKLSDLTIERR